jgi:hypothetical protein
MLNINEQGVTNALVDGTFDWEYHKISVVQCGDVPNPFKYVGAGNIRQESDGTLRLKVLLERPADSGLWWPACTTVLAQHVKGGEIVPENAYFDIEAIDIAGRTWRASRAWISAESHLAGAILTAAIFRIELSVKKSKPSLESIVRVICINDDFTSPSAEFTDVIGVGRVRNATVFQYEQLSCKIIRHKSHVIFEIKTDDLDISKSLVKRLLGAAEFISGSPLQVAYWHTNVAHHELIAIQPWPRDQITNKLPSPIQHQSPIDADDYASLITAMMGNSSDENPAYYRYWTSLFHARQAGTAAFGLAAAVAAEAMVQNYFKDRMYAEAEFVKLCEDAIPLIKEMKLDERIANKIVGTLDRAKDTSTKNALYRLAPVVSKASADAWGKLRHAAAHGTLAYGSADLEKIHHRTFHCIHIFYSLLMLHINYTGHQIDYSTPPYSKIKAGYCGIEAIV